MVAARLEVSLTEPAAQPDVIGYFDREFVFSRGRSISLGQRFADVFDSPGSFVAAGRIAMRLVTALLTRPFAWIEGGREWRGAMIGLVCTDPQYRGNGYAGELLSAAEQRCRAAGCDFAVLWAAQHGLYQRMGWVAADNGILGAGPTSPRGARGGPAGAHDAVFRRIHVLHEERQPRVKREHASYQRLLPPAERLLPMLEGNAYALCGEHGRTGYVYDLAGSAPDLARLWDRLAGTFESLYVNVEGDSGAHAWLREHTPLEWKRQSLALWKPLNSAAVPFQRWYIPFMDRI